ncbi:MAG: insulinase family protein [Bacteroidetes bacterium]|nr:insulinase family protein [Bacteroidota bacterium]
MKKYLLCVLTALVYTFSLTAQSNPDLTSQIPMDSTVRTGKLSNGLKYYIKKNGKPEKRAELRLAVNAGSNYENDDQQGLAHFVEHMAFNGTKNFKKNELVNYLESIGTKFGAHLNAYTSFEETVYMLQLPTDSEKIFAKGFQVLEDWAHNLSFEDAEIEKERGVVISERRSGLGAQERMNQKTWPIVFKGSRYADRLPIGKLEVLEKCKHETLKQFYYDWYRPDLMAVIAVGDFDMDKVEKMIKDHFSGIPAKENPRPTQKFEVPDNEQLLIAKASDKESQYTIIEFGYKLPKESSATLQDMRRGLSYKLFNNMMNERLNELTQLADPPFSFANIGYGPSLARTRSEYGGFAVVKEKGIERGLETLLTENERVKLYGFTESELERQKLSLMRNMEKQYNERDKTESRNLVNNLVSNFLKDEPAPSIEFKYRFYKKYLKGITLADINELARKWSTDEGKNMVITIMGPEKPDVIIPSDERIKTIMANVLKTSLKPYEDKTSDKPLMSAKPVPGKIGSEKQIKELNLTELELSNGVKVILKPTDFKNDEIVFTAYSPGGFSLYDEKDHMSAAYAASLIDESGISEFDNITLNKMLTGKIISVGPYIGDTREGLEGSCSPTDFETTLQLINLYFTAPRKDETGFAAVIEREKSFLENRQSDPESAFRDTINVTMWQYHFRRRPLTLQTLKEIDLNKSFDIYKDRFADAADFTFFFIGNFKTEEIKPMLETYLGSLPSKGRKENWKDMNIRYPKGVIQKTVKRGIEPKSAVQLQYTGSFEYNRQNRLVFNALNKLLDIKLREAIREEKGGTYGVSVYGRPSHYPIQDYSLTIYFGCDPKNVNDLTKTALDVLENIKKNSAEEKDMIKIKETLRREYEVNFKENRFWLNAISNYYFDNENPVDILSVPKMAESLTSDDLKKAANMYLDQKNYAKFVLMPEK